MLKSRQQTKGTREKYQRKEVDILSINQKWQRDKGRFKAIKYFDNVKEEKLTLAEIIFNDVKRGGMKGKTIPSQYQQNQAQPVLPTMCRGRGLIRNRRQGVAGGSRGQHVVVPWFHSPKII